MKIKVVLTAITATTTSVPIVIPGSKDQLIQITNISCIHELDETLTQVAAFPIVIMGITIGNAGTLAPGDVGSVARFHMDVIPVTFDVAGNTGYSLAKSTGVFLSDRPTVSSQDNLYLQVLNTSAASFVVEVIIEYIAAVGGDTAYIHARL